MYGAQTINNRDTVAWTFENDVEMYGAQTTKSVTIIPYRFENDVEMYGAQTIQESLDECHGLRMM